MLVVAVYRTCAPPIPTTTPWSAAQGLGNVVIAALTSLAQFQEVLLRVGANLNHSTAFDEACDLLPALTVQLQSLDEGQVLFARPTSW